MANENKEVVYFKGTLKSSFSVDKKDDNGNVTGITNVVGLYRDGLTVDDSDKIDEFFKGIFKNTAKKYIPDWYKDGKDFASFKSSYNIPVKIEEEDKQLSFAEWVERGEIRGALVTLKCNLRNGSVVYPSALLVHKIGEPYDAFADF